MIKRKKYSYRFADESGNPEQQTHTPGNAPAPVFKDPRTGKFKYAKGSKVNGQSVGGQWAPVSDGSGAMAVGATLGGIVLRSASQSFKRDSKGELTHRLSRWMDDMALTAPGKKLLTSWPLKYIVDADGAVFAQKLDRFTEFERNSGNYRERYGKRFLARLDDIGFLLDHSKFRTNMTIGVKMNNGPPADMPIWEALKREPKLKQLFKEHGFDPALHPTAVDKTGKIVPGMIHNVDDIERVAAEGWKSGQHAGAVKALQGAKYRYLSDMRGVRNTVVGAFIGLSAGYLLDHIWNKMTNKAVKNIKNYAKQASNQYMTPAQLEAYNKQVDEEQKAASPTGGKVGRPRVRPIIPQELKRGRGRPRKSESKNEATRKAKIAQLANAVRDKGVPSNV